MEPRETLARATAPKWSRPLLTTVTAKGLGVFGSPSFVVDREVFWGDDRMEDAAIWKQSGRLG